MAGVRNREHHVDMDDDFLPDLDELDDLAAEASENDQLLTGKTARHTPEPVTAKKANDTISRLGLLFLVLLCVQATTQFLVVRYSRGTRGEKWSKSSAVMFSEIIKLSFSIHMLSKEQSRLGSRLMLLIRQSLPMAVPAVIYFLQNLLGYYALSRISAGQFSILSQMKILSTGIFSVALLNRSLSSRKWRALLLLMLGAILVQLPKVEAGDSGDSDNDDGATMGILAALLMASFSGLSGVYVEKVLKHNQKEFSIWDRNFQLAFYSVFIAAFSALVSDDIVREKGIFFDYSVFTWMVVFGMAGGGLLVALAVKHTNTILKSMATTGSIILSMLIEASFMGEQLVPVSLIGACVTVISIFNFNEPDA
ncbi:MAG: hypothetical protein MHM6MM_004035 [Cercozoa sp. M6MM]